MALYSPDQEANGKVLCTGACESFWKPLEPGTGAPTAESGVARLAVIMRPDGSQQVTDDGKPLYTFSEDSPGKVTGNDFSDDFGGQQFTWHVVMSDQSTGPSGGSTTAAGRRHQLEQHRLRLLVPASAASARVDAFRAKNWSLSNLLRQDRRIAQG